MFKPWIREHFEVHSDPFYSSIVRTDQYRPDKLAKREFDLGQTPTVSGLFDGVANGPKALRIDDVTDIEICIRENRLSQPELDKARDILKHRAISEDDRVALDVAHSASTARSEKLGSIIDSLSAQASKGSDISSN